MTQMEVGLAVRRRDVAARSSEYVAQTTLSFHNDLCREILSTRDKGMGIVEVGCNRAGSSVVLASLCEQLNWPYYIVDASSRCIEITRNILDFVSDRSNKVFFCGTFQDFVAQHKSTTPLNTVFIDADHTYDYVRADLESLYHLPARPVNAAFHDYSLRSEKPELSNLGVDRAIHDVWGAQARLIRIGQQFDDDQPKVSATGSYYEANGTEGVFVRLDEVHPVKDAVRDWNILFKNFSSRNLRDLPSGFDEVKYLELNPDVARAGRDPAEHWIRHGHKEGRRWK